MSMEKNFDLNQEYQKQLDKIKEKAKKTDITYELNRWFGERMCQNNPELLEIQKQGFISEAVAWLKSTTLEGMKSGKATKEERIVKAREFAKKAQTTIEELAERHGIDLT